MNESDYNSKVRKRLTGEGAFAVKFHGQAMQTAGIPDIGVWSLAFTGWIEGKKDDNTMTALQHAVARKLIERGTPVCVLRYPDYVLETIDGERLTRLATKKSELWLPILATLESEMTCLRNRS